MCFESNPKCQEFCGRYGDGIALAVHVFNAALKIIVGCLTFSLALVADGAHSAVDAVTSVMAMFDARVANDSTDEDTAASPSQAATVLTFLFVLAVLLTSAGFAAKGLLAIVRGTTLSPLFPALLPPILSILLDYGILRHAKCFCKEAGRAGAAVNVRESGFGIFSSALCLCGVAGALLGSPVLDEVAAILIALTIPHVVYGVMGDALAAVTGLLNRTRAAATVTDRKKNVAMLSVVSNTVLVVGKIVIGVLIGSVSVVSEGIHSAMDLVAAIIAFFAVRASGHPEDEKHPFGHGKIENVSGTIEALLIFLAAGWIIYEAGQKFYHLEPVHRIGLGMGIMAVSSVANMIVSHYLFKVGVETDSVALQADAWHLRTDVWTSVGVMGGLGIIWIGQKVCPGVRLDWIDPMAAVCVAFLIFHAAWHLTVESGRDLLDVSLPDEDRKWLRAYLKKWVHTGCDCQRLRTRKAGSTRFVEFDLLVSPTLSVQQSHELSGKMTRDIEAHFGEGTQVTILTRPLVQDEVPRAEGGMAWKGGAPQ